MKRVQENAIVTRKIIDAGVPVRVTVSVRNHPAGMHVALRAFGKTIGSCSGCGYDMRGFCVGEFLNYAYAEELRKIRDRVADLPENQGAQFYTPYGMYKSGRVDGGCGLSCMEKIAEMCGLRVEEVYKRGKFDGFIFSRKEGAERGVK